MDTQSGPPCKGDREDAALAPCDKTEPNGPAGIKPGPRKARGPRSIFIEAPHPGWENIFRLAFGFALLLVIAALAAAIALGRVEQNTSFGLQDLLGGLLVLAGGFSNWCFKVTSGKDI